jgi:hypothetical protein
LPDTPDTGKGGARLDGPATAVLDCLNAPLPAAGRKGWLTDRG